MVPPSLQRPDLLAFAPGVLGLAGAAELRFEARPSWAACRLTLLMAMLAAMCAARQGGAREACGVSPNSIPVGRGYRMNRWRRRWHTMFDQFRKDTIRLRRT
jgi:hypothetical protein